MGVPITIELPEDLHRRAEQLAKFSGRALADVLRDSIASSLRPLGETSDQDAAMDTWTNDAVLMAADATLPTEQNDRLSELLFAQQAGTVSESERTELIILMESYQASQLRKAEALRLAVTRGLREPMSRAAS